MSKIDHRAAITNVCYDKTRTKKGNVTSSAVKKAVYYAMFRHVEQNPDQLLRGEAVASAAVGLGGGNMWRELWQKNLQLRGGSLGLR